VTKSEGGLSTSAGLAATETPKRVPKHKRDSKKITVTSKKSHAKAKSAVTGNAKADDLQPIIVKHQAVIPDGLPSKYFSKSTFNTHDIMHAPVEKTLLMLDKILSGERLFTM
jgi:hypothetical protein